MDKEILTRGNILGAARAEADLEMLGSAFVQTHDFSVLTKTHDFNFVVGRRGTGKTALFIKVSEYFKKDKHIILYQVKPEEYSMLSFRSTLEHLKSDYRSNRSNSRICWRAKLLIGVLNNLRKNWKVTRSSDYTDLLTYYSSNRDLCNQDFLDRLNQILEIAVQKAKSVGEIPKIIAESVNISKLQNMIQDCLKSIGFSAIYLFDSLDEGWVPSQESVAILGGLALAVADLRDSDSQVNSISFIRDNIFRALASSDPDFSRHIEDSTLRLHWNEESLYHLVTERLRISLSLTGIESNTKVWNHFAHRGLSGREGFKTCLQYTLYRPRDILVLLNQSFVIAARGNRCIIFEDDIEITSKQIAHGRLNDLIHEYSHVFPGIGLFIKSFKGRPAKAKYKSRVEFLDEIVEQNPYSDKFSSDFAVLGSGTELFNALYSVGFIGMRADATSSFLFCHDGARPNFTTIIDESDTMIHPCYWKALEIDEKDMSQSVLVDINDDYDIRVNPQVIELRTHMLGQLISELSAIQMGQNGSTQFEKWVFRTIKILFSETLTNPEMKPNENAVQRRDVVATNMAENGFWKRVLDDYSARQVIFEMKNYEQLDTNDYRQVLSYSGKNYGKFVFIVYRSTNELLLPKERDWVKEIYDQHDLMIFLLPALFLSRCIKKIRNPQRKEYSDTQLSKRLDTFERKYLALTHNVQRNHKSKR